MNKIINQYNFGDITASYILNSFDRAVLVITPNGKKCDLLSEKNNAAYDNSSLAHLKLNIHSTGIFSNTFKLCETVNELKFSGQTVLRDEKSITVITEEKSEKNYGIRHYLIWYLGERGFEAYTEFFNNSGAELELQYITSASLDALSPYLNDEGSKELVFHRFKTGWSMEGLHQENTLSELGLEQSWNNSGECIKFGAVGSRPVREYHPYAAVEDRKSGIAWGLYLAHNASWHMELSRTQTGVSLSIGLADIIDGMWSKRILNGENFFTPRAMMSAVTGGIAELSNSILSMRHKAIDAYGEKNMEIAYNEFATTWGNPTEKTLIEAADILKRGKTKYLIMDAGWYNKPVGSIGDWTVNKNSFPHGMKLYCDEIRRRGMIPGIWMEFECADKGTDMFSEKYDSTKLTIGGRVIIGHNINGRLEKIFDFRKKEVIKYFDEKVIGFLKNNGFGYLKIDYNVSTGAGVDGDDSYGENLRQHMEAVRNFIIKIKNEIPNIIIENCASGGCRLEPSIMDITAMSSVSDTHDVYEAAVVAANMHYLTPPRQNQIWATLRADFSKERFSYVISQGFLGRLCWSGNMTELSEIQLNKVFKAEEFYEKVSTIIKRGSSYIYRTDPCSFYSPSGTQAVVRYSDDERQALIVVHSFKNMKSIEIKLKSGYKIEESLYKCEACIENNIFKINSMKDFSGNVYLLKG